MSCAKGQKILRPSTLEEVRLRCSPCLDVCLCRHRADAMQTLDNLGQQELVQTQAEVTAGIDKG